MSQNERVEKLALSKGRWVTIFLLAFGLVIVTEWSDFKNVFNDKIMQLNCLISLGYGTKFRKPVPQKLLFVSWQLFC